jgi:hypothetical protein
MSDRAAYQPLELREISSNNAPLSHSRPTTSSMDYGDDGGSSRAQGKSDRDELNRRTLRKLDFVLLPFLALLFLFNSLDRSNVRIINSSERRETLLTFPRSAMRKRQSSLKISDYAQKT